MESMSSVGQWIQLSETSELDEMFDLTQTMDLVEEFVPASFQADPAAAG